MVRINPLPIAAFALLCFGSCGGNNIGRLFDPNFGGAGGQTGVKEVVQGGDAISGRPRVSAAFPTGAGWPESVPIVVVFNESMNSDLMVPAMGDPLVYIRLAGTDAPLPAAYDFLSGGRVVLMRPVAALMGLGASYEIVVDPDTRDIDAVRFGGADPVVVGTFTVDEDPLIDDGRILAMLPQNNATNAQRETSVLAVFTKQADGGSVTPTNFSLATGVTPVPGAVDQPLINPPPLPGVDGRLARFIPSDPLDAATSYDVTVDATITFGAGVLDFGNRTPFSSFTTLSVEAAVSVTVGNPPPGFPDQIGTGNIGTLVVDVEVPASAAVGDRVVVRIYGLDPDTPNTPDDVNFVEATATLAMAGMQTISVDFSGMLGTAANPRFEDGPVTLAAQMQRGSEHAGFILDAGNSRLDVTPPTLIEVGPPMAGDDIITDLEHLAFYGTADEEIGSAILNIGGPDVNLFASSADGRFVMEPLDLGRITAPVMYSLTLTDLSGNMTAMALSGNILQRGAVTGAQAGTLTIEVYDEATLQAIAGATVVLDPGVPTVPATGQLTGVTGPDGRVTFMGLGSPTYTVTAVNSSHDLTTLYNTGAAFVSLPLRPFSLDTASLSGSALFSATPGQSALVGCNVIDDVLAEEIATNSGSPTSIPGTAIRPNRPLVLTAFGGSFEPTANPAFDFQACELCGVNGLTPTPPSAPVAAGDSTTETLVLLQSVTPPPPALMASYNKNFAASTGLGAIAGTPTVRVVSSLLGFSGQALMGVGFAIAGGATDYDVDASYSPILQAPVLAPYLPVTFVSTEATDGTNVARHRAFLNPIDGSITDALVTPGIPTITPQGVPSTGSPAVDYTDRLDRDVVPPGPFGSGFGLTELTATDSGGRDWVVMIEDDGSVGPTTVQFPDLSGIGLPGLQNGNWSILAEEFLYLSTSFALGDFLAEERLRQQVTYARAMPEIYVVN